MVSFRFLILIFTLVSCVLAAEVNQETPKEPGQQDYIVLTTPEGKPVQLNTQSDIDALKEEIAELKNLLQTKQSEKLGKQKKISHEAKNHKTTQVITDQNFKLIEETKDKLVSLLGDRLPSFSDFEGVCDSLTIIKNFIQDDKSVNMPDELIESITRSINLIPEFGNELKKSLLLLVISMLVIDSPYGLICTVQGLPHAKSLNQSQVQKILENLIWQLRSYISDVETKTLNDFTSLIIKSKFEGKPMIPSYFVFTVFNCLAQLLQNNLESIEKTNKTFFRVFDSIINGLTKLTEDLDAIEKSDKTAPNTIQFITNKKKAIQNTVLFLTGIAKDKKSHINEISHLLSGILKELNKLLIASKPQEIFDHIH